MPEDVTGRGAFQAGAFQADAFGLVTLRTAASQMTPEETQTLEQLLLRYKRGEASKQDVIEAVPESARYVVGEKRGKLDWKFWVEVLLVLALARRSDVSMSQLEQGIRDQFKELNAQVQMLDDEEQERFRRVMEELRALKVTEPSPDPKGPQGYGIR